MQTRQLHIEFHTPAFLGDAAQSGRWRTPPFKAQLRQWWRVAYAAQNQFRVNVNEMRDIEGHLFGHAWLEHDQDEKGNKVAARQSAVRLRLNRWNEGQLKSWANLEAGTIYHPETEKTRNQVGPHAYLGFGPLDGRSGTQLQSKQNKPTAAIQAGESAQLSIAYPDNEAPLLDHALQLMHQYGTVGGRSRNGWGSYSMVNTQASHIAGAVPSQTLSNCLRLDWPHALGTDHQGALIWQTPAHKDWAALMKTLAQLKIALRTQFVFHTGKNAAAAEDRHWLSYPVTNHSVASWGNNARLPNTLRFKIRPTPDGQLVGVIFHMPHLPPSDFKPHAPTLERIWHQVHQHLDQQTTHTLKRIAA